MNGGTQFDSDVRDPALRRPLRPGAARRDGPQRAVPRGLAAAHGRDHRQVPAAAAVVRLVASSSRPSSPTSAISPPTTTTGRASGGARSSSTTSGSVRAGHGGLRHRARRDGRHPAGRLAERHVGLEDLVELGRGTRLQDRGRSHRRSSSTWSRRTASCCSTSGRSPDGTIPDEEQAALPEIGSLAEPSRRSDLRHTPWLIPGEGPTHAAAGSFVDAADATPPRTSASPREPTSRATTSTRSCCGDRRTGLRASARSEPDPDFSRATSRRCRSSAVLYRASGNGTPTR